jgi:hypothetical protein
MLTVKAAAALSQKALVYILTIMVCGCLITMDLTNYYIWKIKNRYYWTKDYRGCPSSARRFEADKSIERELIWQSVLRDLWKESYGNTNGYRPG